MQGLFKGDKMNKNRKTKTNYVNLSCKRFSRKKSTVTKFGFSPSLIVTVNINSDTGNRLIIPKQHQCHLQVKSQCQKKLTYSYSVLKC